MEVFGPYPDPQTQNCMMEEKQSYNMKTKVVVVYEMTNPPSFLDYTLTPKLPRMARKCPNKPQNQAKSKIRSQRKHTEN